MAWGTLGEGGCCHAFAVRDGGGRGETWKDGVNKISVLANQNERGAVLALLRFHSSSFLPAPSWSAAVDVFFSFGLHLGQVGEHGTMETGKLDVALADPPAQLTCRR